MEGRHPVSAIYHQGRSYSLAASQAMVVVMVGSFLQLNDLIFGCSCSLLQEKNTSAHTHKSDEASVLQ